MKAIDFKESTKTLNRPDTLTDLECRSLPIWTDEKQCISCWKPSFLERISILIYGRVWLSVWGGSTQPPVWVDGERTVFVKTPYLVRVKNCCDRLFIKRR